MTLLNKSACVQYKCDEIHSVNQYIQFFIATNYTSVALLINCFTVHISIVLDEQLHYLSFSAIV